MRMKESTPEFSELAAFQAGRSQLAARRGDTDRIAKPLRGEFVSGNYFSTFGVGAFAGRTIVPSDDQPSAPPVAMLSGPARWDEPGAWFLLRADRKCPMELVRAHGARV
jgi:hypothetical protein